MTIRRLAALLPTLAAAVALLAAPAGPGLAQGSGAPPARIEGRRLPPDAYTQHGLSLPGRDLRFSAAAGSLPLVDEGGRLQAEIGFVAYTLFGANATERPVTFVVNGGPGASSAYLHLGALGPWRLPLAGGTISPSAPPAPVPNAETWLDFTDLVFLDPPGTGYSRVAGGGGGDEARNRYYAVDADASVLAAAIARWLRTTDRLGSPKFFVGESYGGFRGPLIAGRLQTEIGVGLSGMVLLSPVLDFAWLGGPRYAPWNNALRLPSFAAAAMERRGTPATREALAEVERYAVGDYLADLVRGPRDAAAVERASSRVAALTGLDPALVRRSGARLGAGQFQREVGRAEGRVASAYDATVTGFDPDPAAPSERFEDPILDASRALFTSAVVDHLARTLNWRVPDQRYELLNGSVNRAWRWGGGRAAPEAFGALRDALALDPSLRVLVAHGASDLVTPYFASGLLLEQLPDFAVGRSAGGGDERTRLALYGGGHMFYTRDASRAALRADALRLYDAALAARGAGRTTRGASSQGAPSQDSPQNPPQGSPASAPPPR